MNLSVPENAMWIVLAVGVLIQFFKEFKIFTNGLSRFIPYIAIGLGVVGTIIDNLIVSQVGLNIPNMITGGIAVGLMATGGYEAFKHIGLKKPAITSSTGILLLLLLPVLMLGGCNSPKAQYAASEKIYIATVESLTDMVVAGQIKGEDAQQVKILAHTASDYLDAWHTNLEIGKEVPPDVIDGFNSALEKLTAYYNQKKTDN